jgi:hypothetical protein
MSSEVERIRGCCNQIATSLKFQKLKSPFEILVLKHEGDRKRKRSRRRDVLINEKRSAFLAICWHYKKMFF